MKLSKFYSCSHFIANMYLPLSVYVKNLFFMRSYVEKNNMITYTINSWYHFDFVPVTFTCIYSNK